MKRIILKLLVMVLLIGSPLTLLGQSGNKYRSKSLSIALFNEHVAQPFSNSKILVPHLGMTLAYETSKEKSGVYQFARIFQVGYYYHKDFNQVAFLTWKSKFALRLSNLINIHGILGIGYAHSFTTLQTYKFKGATYEKATNWGKHHLVPSLGIGSGIHLDRIVKIPIELFLRYETFSLAPYAAKTVVPFTLNTMLSAGLKYSFKN